ncbi:MAG: hypothetical protein ABIF04_05550 [Chloroflexota bacterium]
MAGDAQDTQTGTESLFGVSPGGQDSLDRLAGMRSDLICPALDALGCSFAGFLVFDWHMGDLGGIPAENAAYSGWSYSFPIPVGMNQIKSGKYHKWFQFPHIPSHVTPPEMIRFLALVAVRQPT